MDSYNSPTTRPLFRASQIVWYFLGIIETLLVFRFFLKLLSANPEAGFSDFIYNLSYIFVVPFQTVFQTSQVAGSIFEWTTLLAIFVYWLVGVGIMRILAMSKTVSTPEAAEQLEREGV